jgi:hypothetical protein
MSRHVTFMTIDDAEHYTPQERADIIAAYPEHEREARARGVPVLGSGRIFPVAENLIACEPFRLPRYWPMSSTCRRRIAVRGRRRPCRRSR